MEKTIAQLILGIDSTTDGATLRERFERRRDELERQIVMAGSPAQKEEARQGLGKLNEAYAVLAATTPAEPSVPLHPIAAAPVTSPPPLPPAQASIASPTISGSPSTHRSHTGLLIAAVLLLVAAIGGGWWWQHQAAAEHERDRVLAELRALPDDAEPEAVAACQRSVQAAGAGPAIAFRGELEAKLAERRAVITAAWQRQEAALTQAIDAALAQLRQIEAEAAELRTRLTGMPAPETATGPRREYLQARREHWGSYLAWAESFIAGLPARKQLEAAHTALASNQRKEARTALATAVEHLGKWTASRDTARRERYELPWLDACAAAVSKGGVEWASWYRSDDGTDLALRVLGERLAILDRAAAIPPETAAQLAFLTALTPQDSRLPLWRVKLTRVDGYVHQLAVLDDEEAAATRWRECESPCTELVKLVGDGEDPAARWKRNLTDRRKRYDAARAALAELKDDHPPASERVEILDQALEDLGKLVADDDADLVRWRGKLDPLAAESRYRRALTIKDQEAHKRLLVAAARGGNADAGARMVKLAMWGEMGKIDPRGPLLAGWAEGSRDHAGITDRQVYGEFLANWATRHHGEGFDVNAMMLRGRELIGSGALEHPVLLNESGWLWEDVIPADAAKAKEHHRQSCHAAAAAAEAVADDPMVAISILGTAAGAAVSVEDSALAGSLYGKAAIVAEAAGWGYLACYYAVAQAGTADAEHNDALYAQAMQRCQTTAESYHRAGDAEHEGYCLGQAAAAQRPDNRTKGSWEAAIGYYERAAATYAQAGKLAEQARMMNEIGDCLTPSVNPGGNWQRADEYYSQSVALYRRAGKPAFAASALSLRSKCSLPTNNPNGNWDTAASLLGEAANASREGGQRRSEAGYLKQQAECLHAACEKGKMDRWDAAADRYGAAEAVYEALTELDLTSYCLHQQAYCLDPDRNPHGDFERVAGIYRQAISVGERGSRAPEQLGVTYYNLGWSLRPDNRKPGKNASWAEAAEAFGKAADFYEKGKAMASSGQALYNQAVCLYPGKNAGGDYPRSLALVERAIPLLRNQPTTRKLLGFSLQVKATCLLPKNNSAGSWSQAAENFGEAAQVLADAGEQVSAADCLSSQAYALIPSNNSSGSWTSAEELYARAAAIFAREKIPLSEAHCLHQQGVCIVQGKSANMTDQARELFRRSASLDRANGNEEQAKVSEDWLK